MSWADVGATLIGFLLFSGLGASAWWIASRSRRISSVEWLEILDAFEGTPRGRGG